MNNYKGEVHDLRHYSEALIKICTSVKSGTYINVPGQIGPVRDKKNYLNSTHLAERIK